MPTDENVSCTPETTDPSCSPGEGGGGVGDRYGSVDRYGSDGASGNSEAQSPEPVSRIDALLAKSRIKDEAQMCREPGADYTEGSSPRTTKEKGNRCYTLGTALEDAITASTALSDSTKNIAKALHATAAIAASQTRSPNPQRAAAAGAIVVAAEASALIAEFTSDFASDIGSDLASARQNTDPARLQRCLSEGLSTLRVGE